MHEQAKQLITAMWNSLDFSEIKGKRVMGIWDEFIAKIKIALNTETELGAFLNKFCSKFNTNLKKSEAFAEAEQLTVTGQHELLDYIRNNLQIIIVDIRLDKENEKNAKEN